MTVLANRAGMSSSTSGTGDITLSAALGAVPVNQCAFLDFATAGITNGAVVSYLVLDSNGGWECGHATYSSTGPKITGRTVSKSSNAGALLSLSGNNVQVYITALGEDIALLDSVPLAPAFDNDTSAASTGFVQQEITSRAYRNHVVNGDFEIWQRGTSASGTGSYIGVDHWFFSLAVSATVSRQTHTEGQTNVPGARYFMRLAFGTTGSPSNFRHIIEGLRKFNARQVTLSFYAKADAAFTWSPFLTQVYGTGGSPSAADNVAPQNVSVTTAWQRFQLVFTVGSFTGKTFGTTDTSDYLGIVFGEVSGRTVDLSDVQLEFGGIATAFERILPTETLLRCYRYYRVTTGQSNSEPTLYGYAAAGGNYGIDMRHPVPMRVAPSISLSGTASLVNCNPNIFALDTLHYALLITASSTGQVSMQPNSSYIATFSAEY